MTYQNIFSHVQTQYQKNLLFCPWSSIKTKIINIKKTIAKCSTITENYWEIHYYISNNVTLSSFVTLHQNDYFQMNRKPANYSVHINWPYVGCYWILCQHYNWTVILSAQCRTNLHTYLNQHEISVRPVKLEIRFALKFVRVLTGYTVTVRILSFIIQKADILGR